MKWRPGHHGEGGDGRTFGPGFGGLLRSLFANLPWAESASREESLIIPAPAGRSISVHNANGKTRIIGEDRHDIEIRIHKSVRADCPDLATRLLDAIQIQNTPGAERPRDRGPDPAPLLPPRRRPHRAPRPPRDPHLDQLQQRQDLPRGHRPRRARALEQRLDLDPRGERRHRRHDGQRQGRLSLYPRPSPRPLEQRQDRARRPPRIDRRLDQQRRHLRDPREPRPRSA